MNVRSIRSTFRARVRGSRISLVGLLALFCLLVLNACGGGSSAEVYDNARVLNVSKVQRAASQLPVPVAVYTTSTFQGTPADFQRATVQKLGNNPNKIVMAIDTTNRRIYIAPGMNVSANTRQAVNAFSSNFNNGDYTNASVAALNSLQNSIGSRSSGGGLFANPASILCCILPLLVILFLVLFGASRRSALNRGMPGRGLGGLFGMGRSPYRGASPYDQGYGPPNQGYGPPNQGYGPPNQGGGMNPWAAGGLGAAAGGLAGYELGKRQGERDTERQDNDFGSGGTFGGGSGGTFGGGDDFGGGGDFGGGSGGSFGGGSGGGGDFGGGSGGSFGGDDFGSGGDFGGSDFDNGSGGNF